ncbi:MAG: LysR family transcriptional regulator, partial [Candidatus Riflebacteria bacterium]|nr:LysR family transcriptional regulator [Candidatus Riflebacteria bacterium]
MLEIYMLEHIATFAETGTLSAAADKLCISQPALTRSMQKLEKV